nr:hypothetical protein [Tanacetum cinerariifolium]
MKLDDDESLGKGIRRNGGNNDGKKDAVKVFDELSSIKIGTVREHYDAFVPFARQMDLSGLGAISMFLWRLQLVIRRKFSSLNLKTLHDAYYLASMYESDYKHFWLVKREQKMDIGNGISVDNKVDKMEQKREIGNRVIDISIGLMGISLMDCGFTKNGNLVLEPVCEKNEVEQDIGKEKDSNADINVVNGSGGEIIDGKSEDLELINEKSGGFELLEKRSLEFVKLAEVDCDADKTFNSDLEGKFSVGLELGNQYGGASLVATGTISEDDMVKIQEKKEDSEVMNVMERSGLTTLVFSNDGVGDEVITTELRGCGDIWEEGEKGKEIEMVKGNKIVVGSLDVSPLKQPSDAQHLVGEMEFCDKMRPIQALNKSEVKNSAKKNGSEVLEIECNVDDVKKEEGFEKVRNNKWADWKKIVFEGSGNGYGAQHLVGEGRGGVKLDIWKWPRRKKYG